MKILTITAPDGTESHLDLDVIGGILIPSRFNVNQQNMSQVLVGPIMISMGPAQAQQVLDAWKQRALEVNKSIF